MPLADKREGPTSALKVNNNQMVVDQSHTSKESSRQQMQE